MWIDGQPSQHVPADDRGLLYGDGLWETILLRRGRAVLLDAHLERMGAGLKRLQMAEPDWPSVVALIEQLSQESTEKSVLKLIVTRGSGGRGYAAAQANQTRWIVQQFPFPEAYAVHQQRGICLGLIQHMRLAHQPALAGMKHLNRLEQVMAYQGFEPHWQEALMMDQNDFLVEGCMSNVFVKQQNGGWLTPDLSCAGVEGVVRNYLLQNMAELGNHCSVSSRISLHDVEKAQAMFVCNSIMEVFPVTRFGARTYPIPDLIRQFQFQLSEL